jgi:hypothetical protein
VRVIAVDWSGRVTGASRHLWLAEARDRALVRLECGRTREQLLEHLVAITRDDEPIVVGLDFSFSLPAWFLDERGLGDGPALWELARHEGETWLRDCPPPFWGLPGRRNRHGREPLRTTERTLAVGGIVPKSTFQIGGAGAVGTGSVRGWPHLRVLRDAGYAIWPFDDPSARVEPRQVVVEVWPRLCTGPVVKSDPLARVDHLEARLPQVQGRVRDLMAASEDAFDAGFTALGMAAHAHELARLTAPEPTVPAIAAREGWVWRPVRS